MAKVTFLPDNITVEAPVGSKISTLADSSGASMPFGCHMGSCGTCRCLVKEGIEFLNPLTEAEDDLFESLTSVGRTERLACQLVIEKEGLVVLQS